MSCTCMYLGIVSNLSFYANGIIACCDKTYVRLESNKMAVSFPKKAQMKITRSEKQ